MCRFPENSDTRISESSTTDLGRPNAVHSVESKDRWVVWGTRRSSSPSRLLERYEAATDASEKLVLTAEAGGSGRCVMENGRPSVTKLAERVGGSSTRRCKSGWIFWGKAYAGVGSGSGLRVVMRDDLLGDVTATGGIAMDGWLSSFGRRGRMRRAVIKECIVSACASSLSSLSSS